jgi:serine/threonine-protein kinase
LPAADAAVPLDASVLAPRPPPPPAPPVVQAPGVLVVVVKPWATLWIDGKQVGETPYRVSLPAGRHRLRLVNEERGKSEWATVTITPGRTTTIERNW